MRVPNVSTCSMSRTKVPRKRGRPFIYNLVLRRDIFTRFRVLTLDRNVRPFVVLPRPGGTCKSLPYSTPQSFCLYPLHPNLSYPTLLYPISYELCPLFHNRFWSAFPLFVSLKFFLIESRGTTKIFAFDKITDSGPR